MVLIDNGWEAGADLGFSSGGARFFRYIKVTKKVQKIFKKGTKKFARSAKKNAREARENFCTFFLQFSPPPPGQFSVPKLYRKFHKKNEA